MGIVIIGVMNRLLFTIIVSGLMVVGPASLCAASEKEKLHPLGVIGKPIKGIVTAVFGGGKKDKVAQEEPLTELIPTSRDVAKPKRKLFGGREVFGAKDDVHSSTESTRQHIGHQHSKAEISSTTWKEVAFALENPDQFQDYQVKIIAAALHKELGCPVSQVKGNWRNPAAPTNLLVKRQQLGESFVFGDRRQNRGLAHFNPSGLSMITIDSEPFGRAELYRVVKHEAKHLKGESHDHNGVWKS